VTKTRLFDSSRILNDVWAAVTAIRRRVVQSSHAGERAKQTMSSESRSRAEERTRSCWDCACATE
jgi:hypothetical protein